MLCIGKHGKHLVWGGRNLLQELASTKGIGIGYSMLINHFRSRSIVGHWYPIVFVDFHEHDMANMMVLRQ